MLISRNRGLWEVGLDRWQQQCQLRDATSQSSKSRALNALHKLATDGGISIFTVFVLWPLLPWLRDHELLIYFVNYNNFFGISNLVVFVWWVLSSGSQSLVQTIRAVYYWKCDVQIKMISSSSRGLQDSEKWVQIRCQQQCQLRAATSKSN
jgi:hypothetical protein